MSTSSLTWVAAADAVEQAAAMDPTEQLQRTFLEAVGALDDVDLAFRHMSEGARAHHVKNVALAVLREHSPFADLVPVRERALEDASWQEVVRDACGLLADNPPEGDHGTWTWAMRESGLPETLREADSTATDDDAGAAMCATCHGSGVGAGEVCPTCDGTGMAPGGGDVASGSSVPDPTGAPPSRQPISSDSVVGAKHSQAPTGSDTPGSLSNPELRESGDLTSPFLAAMAEAGDPRREPMDWEDALADSNVPIKAA